MPWEGEGVTGLSSLSFPRLHRRCILLYQSLFSLALTIALVSFQIHVILPLFFIVSISTVSQFDSLFAPTADPDYVADPRLQVHLLPPV